MRENSFSQLLPTSRRTPFGRTVGKGYLDFQIFVRRPEIQNVSRSGVRWIEAEGVHTADGLVEDHLIPKVIIHPGRCRYLSAERVGRWLRTFPQPYAAPHRRGGCPVAELYVLQVDEEFPPGAVEVHRVAGDAGRACDLHPCTIVRQAHAIVTGRCGFIPLDTGIILPVRIRKRHYKYIAQRRDSSTAQAVLGKAEDEGIGPIVSAAIFPKIVPGMRTRLHHTQRA